MFYQNGNYMQDLNYLNQNFVPNYYNPYFQNNNMQMMNYQNRSLNAMYPAIYRIIAPVVWQVLQNSSSQYFTEDTLNNLVDTVYNIVEGDVNISEKNSTQQMQNESQTNQNRDRMQQQNINNSNNENKTNALLKDLIKIIFLGIMNKNLGTGLGPQSFGNW